MARPVVEYLSSEEMEFVHEQVLRVLGEVGVAYNSSRAIELLADAGAQVDRDRMTARLDWQLIRRCLDTCRALWRSPAARQTGMSWSAASGSWSPATAWQRTCTTI